MEGMEGKESRRERRSGAEEGEGSGGRKDSPHKERRRKMTRRTFMLPYDAFLCRGCQQISTQASNPRLQRDLSTSVQTNHLTCPKTPMGDR